MNIYDQLQTVEDRKAENWVNCLVTRSRFRH